MPAHRAPEAPLTDEQLRLAYRQLRRPGWPDTLDAALADPLRAPLIRGLARSLSRVGMDRSGGAAPVPQPPAPAPEAVQASARPPAAPAPAPAPARRPATRADTPSAAPAAPWRHPRWPFAGAPGPDRKRLAANDRDD